jgi:hypothetical protein
MAEAMRMALGYTRPLTQPSDQLAEHVLIEASIESAQEQGRGEIFSTLAFSEVAPQAATGRLAQVNRSTLATFGVAQHPMFDQNPSVRLINVTDSQRTQLAGQQAGVQQRQDDGPVSFH